MLVLLLCLLLNIQCCVFGMPLRDCDEGSVNSNYHVSMRLFHEMYSFFCRTGGGGDCFFDSMSRYDPPSLENGNKTLEERYHAWRTANHVELPSVKVAALVSMEPCHDACKDYCAQRNAGAYRFKDDFSMQFLHEAYKQYCITRTEANDKFFERIRACYPDSEPEGGTLADMYNAWRTANHIDKPPYRYQGVAIPLG